MNKIELTVEIVDQEESKEAEDFLQVIVVRWPKLYNIAVKKWRVFQEYLEKTEILMDLFDSSMIATKILPLL